MPSSMRIAVLVSVATLFLTPAVFAQSTSQTSRTPSQADFDACNEQAKAQAGSPSAGARPRTGPMITGPVTPEAGTQGAPGPSSPSASGAAENRAQSAAEAQSAKAPAESGQPTSGAGAGGSKDVRIPGSDIPGAREAGLSGMAAAGHNDVAYQQAYRDCMKSRGF